MTNKLYDKGSIESLSPLEFTRLRPGVYAGDTTYSTQLLVEIVANAIDEFRLGHGNKIEVTIKDKEIFVRDYGQGFLINEIRGDNKTTLEAAFSVLNTSGKYREDGTYEGTSLGSFGIGGKITNFLSHSLKVQTWRGGEYETCFFKEGVFVERQSGVDFTSHSGTLVQWLPSEEFFTHQEVEIEKVKDWFKTITCLCQGLTILLNNNGKEETFYSKKGLDDLADSAIGDKEIINNRCIFHFEENKNKMDFLLTYTSNYSLSLVPYVNTGLTEKGLHITQVKTILTRELNKFFREKKWLKEKDGALTGEDLQEGMYVVFNITAPNVAYDAQVKSTVTKIDMKPFSQALANNLRSWFEANEKEIKTIADKAISAKKAREAAKKARENVRDKTKKKEKALKFDSKLADCYSKDRSKCEIYVTEGEKSIALILLTAYQRGHALRG